MMNSPEAENSQLKDLGIIASRLNTLICSVSSGGYLVDVNQSWQTVLGWSNQELLTNSVMSFIHPEDRQATQKAAEKLTHDREVIEFRNRYKHKSGHYIWLQWSATYCADLPRAPFIATAMVVNKTVEMEHAAKISSDTLNQAEKIAKIGHWNLDIKTNKLFWSEALFDIHGVTPDTFTPDLESAINFYHPEDMPIVTGIVEKALKEGKSWAFNLRIIRADGEVIPVRCISDIDFDKDGKASAIYGVLQDISDYDLLNSRCELLSKVVEASSTGIVICDESRNIVWANTAFEKLTKYSLAELIGKSVGPLLQGPQTDPQIVDYIRAKLNAAEDVNVEILNYDKDGHSYWNNLLISAVKKDNKVTHFIGLQHDISQKKKQQEMIARNQKMEVIGQLAAGICHDFNNVMAIISGNIQLLSMSNNNPELTKYIDNLETATDRATSLTKRLNKVSKNEPAIFENVFIDYEIQKVCMMIIESLPKEIHLNSELNANTEIKCQKAMLLDSMINLILNAKHALKGAGKIVVKTELREQWDDKTTGIILKPVKSDKYCVISVIDNGSGIAPENINRVFEPFYSTRADNQNIGLGLSQLFDHANNQGLGIILVSEVGSGTEISLWLPNAIL